MTARLSPFEVAAPLYKKQVAMGLAVAEAGLDRSLNDLVNIRASQMNGCAFCLDMHVKEATLHGERPLRLHHVAIWRESALFTDRERAALEWTEALTKLAPHGVGDETYAIARAQFSEAELTALTFAIMTINGWNRLSIAFRAEPGSADQALGLAKAGLN